MYRALLSTAANRHIIVRPVRGSVRHYSSPFKVFMDTLKEQIKKDKDIKTLQDESGRLTESDALKKAKEMLEKAKAQQSAQSERLKQATEKISKAAEKVGSQVNESFKKAAETEFAKDTSEKIKKAAESINKTAEPLKKSPTVEKISDSFKTVIKDESGRYTGFVDKETRRKMREEAQKTQQTTQKTVAENPEAGAHMVLHKDSKWKESWSKFKEESPIMQGIFRARKNYEESDNLFISYTRAFTDRVSDAFGSIFEESDQAQAIRAFQMIDPTFNMDKFMVDARTYIVPELMEAYLKGDVDTLKLWCSEATYNVLTAVIQAQVQQGLISDCKIQDLRDIELVAAKILENDVPVLVLSFRTQEIIVFRNARTGEIAYGKEDLIEQVTYACVLTKEPEDLQNPVTNGWRIIDMAKHDSRPVW
ncbi:TIM44 subunit of mitochondria import inner membrane translocase [Rhizopus microsporus var. microsporus]|uniref:Mitochondrial import inner membrane translocase subunit TIM44 n=2 Tax=Rhizopus microsporus TaxID=58291 RepID=A0A2G4SWT9_RHIZD|nr:TIM44 subunit of mitochondria import inner membrane translocase [Rhizopus microsporus ATCC 52813]ORE01509.1 TIM44 subunit of mitochondria import inner membrane translocase [Rhizopus microsporus var. microsporus]PHZ12836.1 TIM44 subunit of mitochondria import inner membrane translocase [Rhizopus microsporus ATCC 52813]